VTKTDKPQGFYTNREDNAKNILLDFLPDDTGAILKDRLTYVDEHGIEYHAWPGMYTDGGSIPRFAWSIIGPPFRSVYLKAYIIHDAGWTRAQEIGGSEGRQIRRIYNEIFPGMLQFLGCCWMKRRTMYRAVQVGALTAK
jgi:hypothetical protein